MDAYQTIRAARTEWDLDEHWGLSIIRCSCPKEEYDVAVLKDGYCQTSTYSLGGPWVGVSPRGVDTIKRLLRRAVRKWHEQ